MAGEAELAPHVVLGLSAIGVSSLVLLLTYAGIIFERVNRAIVALLGAGAMVFLGCLDQGAAIRGIDFNTIALLTGMMLIVAIAKRCGIFQAIAIRTARTVHASPAGVLFMLQLVTATLSAFLDNVTTVLLVVPVTLIIVENLKLDPTIFLVAEIFSSNIGGTATLIGDPPNILIGSQAGLTFNQFLYHLTPVVIVVLLVQAAIVHWLWGRHLTAAEEDRARVMQFDEREAITDRALLAKFLGVIALVILGFMMARPLGVEPGTTAMTGAALLLLLDNLGRSPEQQSAAVQEAFGQVEWITIFFFIGLFVVVAGVERSGLLHMLSEQLIVATGGNLAATALAVLWASALLSSIVDNIPFVATMIPLIKGMAPAFGGPEGLEPLWWSLALGACLGGNGTLIGASANLTVAGLAERAGHPIRFLPFMRIAFPMMLLSIAISTANVALRYLLAA